MIALLARYWYFVAIAALLAGLGFQELRVNNAQTDLAEYKQEVQAQALAAEQAARAEETRRQEAYDEQAAHARKEIRELEATVSALADTSDGLRDTVAKYQRSRQTTCSASGSKSKPGEPARDLLADLYLGLIKAAEDTSGFAERVYIAGDACEKSGDKAR